VQQFEFTENWFQHTAQWWTDLFEKFRWPTSNRRSVLEIGSFEGQSTVWMLMNLMKRPADGIVCIDPFTGSEEHTDKQTHHLFERFKANVAQTGKAAHVRVLRMPSAEALPRLVVEGYRCDFAYIDGSHRAADVLADLCASWSLLNPGGLCICDDFLWQPDGAGASNVLASPKIAIDAFTTIYADQIQIIRSSQNYQVAFLKLGSGKQHDVEGG
jgi:predicted O-methyltransferase YrrM